MASPAAPFAASSDGLHLAVALDGTGWHPGSWREPGARPRELFGATYWAELVRAAEDALLDLVTFVDAFAIQSDVPGEPDARTDRVRGRLDAVLVAARVAPLTTHIGLVPAAVVPHTEPFHIAKAIATLDHVALGRAGVQPVVWTSADEAALFGRRTAEQIEPGRYAEAADYVEVLRRLWDSWEDDAEIRDESTGRFVDRDKLHYVDFTGENFSVRGPSITPRPPQGQPVVAAAAHDAAGYRLLGRSADLGFVTPQTTGEIAAIRAAVSAEQDAAGRTHEPVRLLGDLLVVLDHDTAGAAARLARLDELAGAPLHSDAHVLVGTPAQVADLVQEWHAAGLDGVRLRPAGVTTDLPLITGELVPELQRRGLFRTAYEAGSLRGLLGMTRPANRYAATGGH